MIFWNFLKHLHKLFLFALTYGWQLLQVCVACGDWYECRFGNHCCKETGTCHANCKKGHKRNVGAIVGIVSAIALSNVLFWDTFCCLCWCKGSAKTRLRYHTFFGSENYSEADNTDDTVIGDNTIDTNAGVIDDDRLDSNHCAIRDHAIDSDDGRVEINEEVDRNISVINNTDSVKPQHFQERTKVLDNHRSEEVRLSIIKIKPLILAPKK